MDSSCLFSKIANTFGQRRLLFFLPGKTGWKRLRKGEEPDRQPSRLPWPSSLASDAHLRKVSFWSQVSPELNPCNWTWEGAGRPGTRANQSHLPFPLAQHPKLVFRRSKAAWVEL